MTNKIECNCSLSIRLCGDGCKKCQPDTYIFNLEVALQSAEQEIEQLRSAIESLKKAMKELISIVEIHSKATENNFAWAEIEFAKEVLEDSEVK
jgi:uncharacterized protein YabN with tetrapyrrole methylase and pyrophosphatase domain